MKTMPVLPKSLLCTCLALLLGGMPSLVLAAESEDAQSTPGAKSQLSLERLFAQREFDSAPVPALVWSTKAAGYFVLEAEKPGEPKGIWFYPLPNGERRLVVAANAFVPEGTSEQLRVEGFTFSPDESHVLLYTNSQRVWRQNTRGDYWILNVPSGKLQKLGGDIEPSSMMFAKFSPDGTRVAYVHDNNLFVQSLDDLNISQLTLDGSSTCINGTADWVNEEELSLRDCFRWSPDGEQILFWQFDTSGVPEFSMVNYTADKYPRFTTFAYPKVGQTNSSTRIGVINSSGGDVLWVALPGDPREHYIPHAEWHPGGQSILLQQFNRLQTENRVFQFALGQNTLQHLFTEADAAWLENDNPVRWLDGGKSLLWLSERSGWRQVYRADIKPKSAGESATSLKKLTAAEFDVIEIESFPANSAWVYFSASPDDATQRYLYRVHLENGTIERVSPSDQAGWHTYNIAPDGKWAVHHFSTFSDPPTVDLIRLEDHSTIRVFTDNQVLRQRLQEVNLPSREFFKVSVDGLDFDGWVLKPSHFDASEKYPLLVHVYGEPYGQTVKDAWGGNRALWHWMLAEQGYVVISIDNRGTIIPKGRAWRKSVHRQIGTLASQDQATAIKKLVAQWDYIDPQRIGVWGWSGGGSMSLNAVFRYPDLYRTAVAVAPVPDQTLYDSIYQERYMGLPDDNAEGYRQGSPITHAKNLQGNLLIIHGTGDDNCHYQGVELLIDELVRHNKHFTVLPYPNRSHSIQEGDNTVVHFYTYITRYLRDHLLRTN